MPTHRIRRGATLLPGEAGKADSSPIYLDSDTGTLKIVPGASGTTEKEILDASTAQTLTSKTLTAPVLATPTFTKLTEVVVATNVITAAESGSTFFLNAATEFVSTLPAPFAGGYFKFVITGAPSGASYTVVGASGTPIHGMVLSKDLNAASDSGTTNGTGVLTLTFVDGKSVKGDTAIFESDGTDWFVLAFTGGNLDAITLS